MGRYGDTYYDNRIAALIAAGDEGDLWNFATSFASRWDEAEYESHNVHADHISICMDGWDCGFFWIEVFQTVPVEEEW